MSRPRRLETHPEVRSALLRLWSSLGCPARGSCEAAAFRHIDLHQLPVMYGELDYAVAQPPECLDDDAQMLGKLGVIGGIEAFG